MVGFKRLCRFEYDGALVARTSKRALGNGVDLRLFVRLPVSSPGQRKYMAQTTCTMQHASWKLYFYRDLCLVKASRMRVA